MAPRHVSRGDRKLLTDRPSRRRANAFEFEEITPDGVFVCSEVPYDQVLPRARTARQLRKKARLQKGGVYGLAVIVHPLNEMENDLLMKLGSVSINA